MIAAELVAVVVVVVALCGSQDHEIQQISAMDLSTATNPFQLPFNGFNRSSSATTTVSNFNVHFHAGLKWPTRWYQRRRRPQNASLDETKFNDDLDWNHQTTNQPTGLHLRLNFLKLPFVSSWNRSIQRAFNKSFNKRSDRVDRLWSSWSISD